MSVSADVAIELPVISAATLGVLGWLGKRAVDHHDRRQLARAHREEARDDAITEVTKAVAVLVEAHDSTRDALENLRRDGRREFDDVKAWRDRTDRSITNLRENTAVLAAMLERSERYHPAGTTDGT